MLKEQRENLKEENLLDKYLTSSGQKKYQFVQNVTCMGMKEKSVGSMDMKLVNLKQRGKNIRDEKGLKVIRGSLKMIIEERIEKISIEEDLDREKDAHEDIGLTIKVEINENLMRSLQEEETNLLEEETNLQEEEKSLLEEEKNLLEEEKNLLEEEINLLKEIIKNLQAKRIKKNFLKVEVVQIKVTVKVKIKARKKL